MTFICDSQFVMVPTKSKSLCTPRRQNTLLALFIFTIVRKGNFSFPMNYTIMSLNDCHITLPTFKNLVMFKLYMFFKDMFRCSKIQIPISISFCILRAIINVSNILITLFSQGFLNLIFFFNLFGYLLFDKFACLGFQLVIIVTYP